MGYIGESKTVCLGAEYNHVLRDTLVTVLRDLGGRSSNHDWGLGGSQEIESLLVEIDGQTLVITSETYVGLSLTGPNNLVDEVRRLVEAKLQDSKR